MSSVLIISPHADDEVLGAGGTISKLKSEGNTVNVIIVADRVYPPDRSMRDKQIANCREVLGYNFTFNLKFKDEHLNAQIVKISKKIESVCAEVDPDIVYTCFSGDNNQDHRAVFDATSISCRRHANKNIKRLYCYEVPSSTDQTPCHTRPAFIPNFFSEITEQQLRIKQSAMKCYSQEIREYPNPRSLRGLEIHACKRGMECNSEYAEAFMLVYGKD